MICKYCGKEMRLGDVDYNKLSYAEFLLISNAIIYGDNEIIKLAVKEG